MSQAVYTNIECCRSCASRDLHPLISLGSTPLADRLVTADQLGTPPLMVPLNLLLCTECSLVQLQETVCPEELFCHDYPYFSSVSPRLNAHFKASAEELMDRFTLDPGNLVVEAASNDGYLLQYFAQRGLDVLGIDPAEEQGRRARQRGVPTKTRFFSAQLAREMVEEGKSANLFLANNVLAHVANLNDFVEGISILLNDCGSAVIEVPYVLKMLEYGSFDTVYHQHLCYFSVSALFKLFRQHGLCLNEIKPIAVHGGSLRLFVSHRPYVHSSVSGCLAKEQELGLHQPSAYQSFLEQIEEVRRGLPSLLEELSSEGARVAAYGAAAKGTTLLSVCNIERKHLDYVVDLSPFKHGLYLPGIGLPIVPPTALQDQPVDYLLLLAWNFAQEIREQQKTFEHEGGRFLLPLPKPQVVKPQQRVQQAV